MMTFILFFNEACLNNLASNVFLFFIFDLCLLRFYYFGLTLHFLGFVRKEMLENGKRKLLVGYIPGTKS